MERFLKVPCFPSPPLTCAFIFLRATVNRNQQQQQQIPPIVVESLDLEDLIKDQESPVVTMADNRTMAELLQAPTEGYEDAIVVPAITADNFELKHSLLTLVQNKQFFGHGTKKSHAHTDTSTRSLLP
ncbi:hypothetical protein Tco_0644157 [Tanacetum coccineum]